MSRSLAGGRRTALLALFAGGLAIGSSGIFVRLSETGTSATAFWRGALALPMLAAWMIFARRGSSWHRQARPGSPSNAFKDPRMFWAGAFFAADLALWHWSVLLTSVAASTLEVSLAPLAITLFAWLCWGVRPSRQFLVALILALIGLVLIVAPNLQRQNAAFTGDVIGLSAAFFYAGYIIIIARLRATYDTATVMFLTTVAFALVSLPLALTQKFVPDTPNGWAMLGALALLAHCVGQGLIAYALAQLPATVGSVGIYMQPVAAGVYAWVLLGEALRPIQILGGGVTICAIGLATAARSYGRDPAISTEHSTAIVEGENAR